MAALMGASEALDQKDPLADEEEEDEEEDEDQDDEEHKKEKHKKVKELNQLQKNRGLIKVMMILIDSM